MTSVSGKYQCAETLSTTVGRGSCPAVGVRIFQQCIHRIAMSEKNGIGLAIEIVNSLECGTRPPHSREVPHSKRIYV